MFNTIIAQLKLDLKTSILNRARRKNLEVKASRVIIVTWNENWSAR